MVTPVHTTPAHTPLQDQGDGATASSLYDVLDLILEKGLVIDAFVRVSLVGIELLTVDARIVIASVDTYLRFAAATNRLDLERRERKPGVPELMGYESNPGLPGVGGGPSLAGNPGQLASPAAQGAGSGDGNGTAGPQQAARSAQTAAGGSPSSMTGRLADWFCRYAEKEQAREQANEQAKSS